MKKLLCVLLLAALLLPAAVFAEGSGDVIKAYSMTFDRNATVIDMGKTPIVKIEKFIDFLSQFPNLERVVMWSSTLKRDQIFMLKEAYPDVIVDCVLAIGDHRVRTDVVAFSTMHSCYSSKSPHHTTRTFEPLQFCYNLRALDLGHNDITDISFMKDMDLQVLILADNDVTDISPLAGMKNLQYAELFMNKISDLTPLTNCPLLDLNICYNAVSDWSPLMEIKTLERLWLSRSARNNPDLRWLNMPEEIVAPLREALPNCVIDSTASGSTDNNWRKHPRFQLMYAAWRNNAIEPFPNAEELAAQEKK